MKIIVNKGFCNSFSRIIVSRNDNENIVCPAGESVCEFESTEGERISVKLRFIDTFSPTICTFIGRRECEIVFVETSGVYRVLDKVTYVLPYACLFLLALRLSVTSEVFGWVCAIITAVTALLLICLKLSVYIAPVRRRIFTHRFM